MAREKVVRAELAAVGTQVSDLTLAVGGSSQTGTATTSKNPMVGDRLWNSVAAVAEIGFHGGSWTIEIQGDVAGIENLPFARLDTVGAPDGVSGNYPLVNLCNSPAMPTPTDVLFDETAAGGLTATVNVLAKTYRGSLSSGPSNSFRVVEGIVYTTGNITAATTIDMSANPPSGGTFANYMGLDKYHLWDACNWYVEASGLSGNWTVDAIGLVGGKTASFATSPAMIGTDGTGASKCALTNNFYGPVPKPSGLLFSESTGGAQLGASFSVCVIAKAHRGQRFKI